MNRSVQNLLYNALGFIFPLAITLISTRYIVHKLTVDIYGLYVLSLSIMGLISFFDLGFGQGIIKFVSRYNAQNDNDRINKVIDVSLIIHTVMGLAGTLLVYLPAEQWARYFLHVPDAHLALAVVSLKIVAFGFFFNLLNGVFANIPKALERYDIAVKIQNGIFIASTGSVLLLLYLGQGLLGALIATLGFQVIGVLVNVYFSYRLLPSLKIRLQFSYSIFREIFKFSFFTAMNVLTGNIVIRIDKMIVGRYLGTQGVSYYNISFMVSQMGSAFIGAITQQLFPSVSSLQSLNDHDQLVNLYQKACRYTFFVAFVLTASLIILGDTFVGLWMGEAFAEKARIMLPILAVVFFFSSITSPTLWFYTGLGYTYINLLSSATGSFCYLLGAFYLIPSYGFYGAVLAFCLIQVPLPLYQFYLMKYVLKMNSNWYLALMGKTLLLLTIVFLIKQSMPILTCSISTLAVGGAIVTILCFSLSYIFGLIDTAMLWDILRKVRRKTSTGEANISC